MSNTTKAIAAIAMALTLALAAPASAHEPPPPGTGGWIPNTSQQPLRPDGKPVTHTCGIGPAGSLEFSILDNGDPDFAQRVRSMMFHTHQVTGTHMVEKPWGQVGNGGIQFLNLRVAVDVPGYTDTNTKPGGWNWDLNTVYIDAAHYRNVSPTQLTRVIYHEGAHAIGMLHTPSNWASVTNGLANTWTMSDGAALLYLLGHPPEAGEPCFGQAWVFYPSGCIRISGGDDSGGHPIPGDWVYDDPTDTWWDPQDGFIGASVDRNGAIWRAQNPGADGGGHYRCRDSNGATQ